MNKHFTRFQLLRDTLKKNRILYDFAFLDNNQNFVNYRRLLNGLIVPINFDKASSVALELKSINVESARHILSRGFVSAVGHEARAKYKSLEDKRITLRANPEKINCQSTYIMTFPKNIV